MKILLDADMLLFKSMAATEIEIELTEDVWTRHSDLPCARQYYWDAISDWCDYFSCTQQDVVHCFTDASAFRRELFPEYKANRKGTKKPIGYKALRSELLSEDYAFMYSKIEADDLLGILATQLLADGEEYVIASGDKDLLQIPGRHVWIQSHKEPEAEDGLLINTFGSDDKTYVIKTPSLEYSERFTYRQYLQGDSTDGIPGCPGVGEVGAQRIVDKFDLSKPVDCWEEIVRTYEAKGKVEFPSEVATQQARLIRVLRAGDYDFETHEVSLWNPPTH